MIFRLGAKRLKPQERTLGVKSAGNNTENSSGKGITPRWLQSNLLKWFDQYGRKDLPWKKPVDPYRIWLSEVMLQQTQVSSVIDYFNKFTKAFPSIDKLAQAPLEKVLALWAGLGYYARARNLHRTAQIIHQEFANHVPQTVEALMDLPGIGRSTAGAILAQSFNLPTPILDGNVKRVLCRLHRIEGYPDQKSIQVGLWQLAEKYTPKNRAADYTQAIMDLGATCCTRKAPLCERCPLQKKCLSFLYQEQDMYPHKKPSKTIPTRHLYMLCLFNKRGEILLEERPQKGIWGGLFSLPEFSQSDKMHAYLHEHFAEKKSTLKSLPPFKHTFTHFHLKITPFQMTVKAPKTALPPNKRWQKQQELSKIGLPAPIKKLLSTLPEEE